MEHLNAMNGKPEAEVSASSQARRPYRSPEVTIWGDFADLTKGDAGAQTDTGTSKAG